MKRGFTLIELLAVILILGIIALIAIPTVTDIIEDSKKGALKASANNLLKVAEQQCNIERMRGSNITNTYTIIDGNVSSELNVKNLPDSGTINVDSDCNATVAIVEGNYCAISDSEGVTVNTNIAHCAKEVVTPVEPPRSCFTFTAATGTITNYNANDANCGNAVIIPSQIDGVDVVNIGEWAFFIKGLTSVIIPNSVTNIENAAFASNLLTSVIIPNSVTSIGAAAFEYNNLTSVTIPNNVTSIGRYAFYQNNLTSVTIPNSVTSIEFSAFNANSLPDSQAFIYKRNSNGSIDNTTLVSYGGAKRENVIIPNSVTSIVQDAFYQSGLTSVIIGSSISAIDSAAFRSNNGVTITINKPTNSVSGSPWGATNATINWTGSN